MKCTEKFNQIYKKEPTDISSARTVFALWVRTCGLSVDGYGESGISLVGWTGAVEGYIQSIDV